MRTKIGDDTDLFIVAGEASGDQLGAGVLQELPGIQVAGIGGPKMRALGMEVAFPMEALQVMGFVDVFLALPHLIKLFRKTVDAILNLNPKVVLTIDYPGFNLRLAKALRKKGYRGKICHYICPSVWAWGKKRIKLMAENLDLLLSVLPFEKSLFASTSLAVEYIGHPLVQKIPPLDDFDHELIAFFPGSRKHEIEKNLPFFLRLITTLQKDYPRFKYVISIAAEKYRPLLEKMTSHPLLTSDAIKQLKPFLAVAKSGTIALELALQEIPTVVTYAISPLDLFLAKYIFKVSLPFYALPNIILGKEVFPELIGPPLTDTNLLNKVKNLITNREACKQECQTVRNLLQPKSDSPTAGQLILNLIKG